MSNYYVPPGASQKSFGLLIDSFTPKSSMDLMAMAVGAYAGWWLTQGSSDMVHYGASLAGGAVGVFASGAFSGRTPIAFGGF